MARSLARIALILALLVSGCSSAEKGRSRKDAFHRGGTLRLAITDGNSISAGNEYQREAFDPQLSWDPVSWELLRSSLTRTLLMYNGHPTEEGGAELKPDLATALPEVSSDGLTWTFHIRKSVHYGPPLASTEIVAADFVRAFQREARVGLHRYGFFYEVIDGFQKFELNKASSITGLETPDDHTLVIHLVEPAGDFGHRLALPGISPLPADPKDPRALFGVATGHRDDPDGSDLGYGHFLVSSGPYMIEGSEKLDPTKPARLQVPVSGFVHEESLKLVRNPSWRASQDPIRGAYIDVIAAKLGGDISTLVNEVGPKYDVVLSSGYVDAKSAFAGFKKLQSDPSRGRIAIERRNSARFISINVALPPFDDIHARKAINYAIDRDKLIALLGGGLAARPFGHIAPDSFEGNLLVSYNPYQRSDRLVKAKQEMALSRYDRDHDGVCDSPSCSSFKSYSLDFAPGSASISSQIAADLGFVGVKTSPTLVGGDVLFSDPIRSPKAKIGLRIFDNWSADYLNASNYFDVLFSSRYLGQTAPTLVGATSAQLAGWGYEARSVPSVDDRVAACLRISGPDQTTCWATLDQYMTEEVVPWVPLWTDAIVEPISDGVEHFSHDQWSGEPALDQISLKK